MPDKKQSQFFVFILLSLLYMAISPLAYASSDETDAKAKNNFSGSYLASRFSREAGDMESSTKDLAKIYKQNPDDVEIASQLMGLYLMGGQVDKAMEIAETLAKTDSKEQIPALILSLQAIKNNDVASASKSLDAIATVEGGQLWLPLISDWLDAEQHKLTKPLTLEELPAEVGKAAPLVYYHLALINAKAGFIDAATEDFHQAVNDDPKHPPARIMAMLLAFYDKNNSPEALKKIVADYRAANPNLDNKIALVSSVQDGVAEVLYTMGSIMLAGDMAQDATLYLQLTLYIKSDMEAATLTLAQAYGELNQHKIAGELLAKIPQTSPLYANAQLYSAVSLAALKKYKEAIAKLDALIVNNPNDMEAYIAKGEVLREQDKFAEAIVVYDAALATKKDKTAQDWAIYFTEAMCYDKLGKWDGTEKNLKKALELSPAQADVLNYYGYSLLMRGEKLPEAKSFIEKAMQIHPDDPQIMDSMGLALYLTGDYAQAAEYLEAAISLLPADAIVNEHLGDAYFRLGRKTEAKFQWERALNYTKDEAILQEIRKKLKDGLPQAAAVVKNDAKLAAVVE